MIKWTKIVVIGAGGTGSLLFNPLCRYLYSKEYLGEIVICDGDKYDTSNASRQMFALSKVGMNKAEYQVLAISSQLPEIASRLSYIDEYLSQKDIQDLIVENTLVINCVDNLAARKYVEDRISELDNAAHICCGNDLRHGQVQTSLRINGEWRSPTIYEESPIFNNDNDDRSDMTCQDLQELESGGQIIAANFMAAALALNYVIQLIPPSESSVFDGTFIQNGFTYFDTMTNCFESRSTNEVVLA